jgi:NADPH-dependent glutamate synthase beta subunit-like oxidoreductase
LKATDITDPNYFHKVVDCQWACPAHTPVPEYIRMIAHGRFEDAYMLNWKSNVFPVTARASRLAAAAGLRMKTSRAAARSRWRFAG